MLKQQVHTPTRFDCFARLPSALFPGHRCAIWGALNRTWIPPAATSSIRRRRIPFLTTAAVKRSLQLLKLEITTQQTGALAKMWPRVLSTIALSTALGTHFFIVGVSSLISPPSTHPLSVPPSPMKQACRFQYRLVPKKKRMIPSPVTAVASYGPPLDDLQPVPEDDTFRPIGFLRELIAAPVPPADCNRFDGIGKETGGVLAFAGDGIAPKHGKKEDSAWSIYFVYDLCSADGSGCVLNFIYAILGVQLVVVAYNTSFTAIASLQPTS